MVPVPDWRPHFQSRGNYRADCRLCQASVDVRAGRPLKHLRAQHPAILEGPAPSEAPSAAGPPAGGPASKASPGGSAPPPAATPSGSREELLEGLWADSRNPKLTATERARARELIAKVEGYADEKEADPDEARRRHLQRVNEAMERQGGSENEVLTILCHAETGRAARVWLSDLIQRAEAMIQ